MSLHSGSNLAIGSCGMAIRMQEGLDFALDVKYFSTSRGQLIVVTRYEKLKKLKLVFKFMESSQSVL